MQTNLSNFKLLHNHLMSILTTNNFEHERLPEKIMQYIGMIVESERNPALNEDFFDYFCENAGHKIIRLTLEVDPMLSVKVLSMLFINLTSHAWISYLLCQPFIVHAIQFEDVPHDEEWPEYYISLLKSLSIRLNEQQLSLFFNKKFCRFPLLYEALKYYNHPDCMVRTNVMNIILGVMKIKDNRLSKYFGAFPFTSYVLTYCCQVKSRIESLHAHLLDVTQGKMALSDKADLQKHISVIKSYYIDVIDYLCYLNDLIELGSPSLAFFVINSVFVYVLLPVLPHLKVQAPPLLATSSLFLVFTLFKTITDDKFKSNLTLLLMARDLPAQIGTKVSSSPVSDHVYIPKVYSQEFTPNQYYWNKFQYQVEKECVKLFGDISNFQIEHETKKEDETLAQEFGEQISRISHSLGFNMLDYSPIQNTIPFSEIMAALGLSGEENKSENDMKIKLSDGVELVPNTVRQSMMGLLEKSLQDPVQDSLILCICTLLNNLSKSETTSNRVLQYCGLLLPRTDTISYKQAYNIKSLEDINQNGLKFIKTMDNNNTLKHQHNEPGHEEGIKEDIYFFTFDTTRNFTILLLDSMHKRASPQQQALLLEFYRTSLLELKELVVKKNMKILVENFQYLYSKWSKEALFHSTNLSQLVLSPRQSAKQLTSQFEDNDTEFFPSKMFFANSTEKVVHFVLKFVLAQGMCFRYFGDWAPGEQSPVFNLQRFNIPYAEKYKKIEQTLKIGHSYQMGYKSMVECYTQDRKAKNSRKLILVEDCYNLVIIEPSTEENSAKVIVNHPWKYVIAEVQRESGRKMKIRMRQGKGETSMDLFFDNEPRTVGTLEWINGLKYERYQSEQAFILVYLKECLSKF